MFPTYKPGTHTKLRALTPNDALAHLLENSFDFAAVGGPGAARLLDLAANTPCFTFVHGGQDAHVDVLEERFGSLR